MDVRLSIMLVYRYICMSSLYQVVGSDILYFLDAIAPASSEKYMCTPSCTCLQLSEVWSGCEFYEQ